MIDAATRFSRSDASKIRDLAEANQLGRKCSEASIKNNIRRFRRIMSTLTDGKSFGGQMRPFYLPLITAYPVYIVFCHRLWGLAWKLAKAKNDGPALLVCAKNTRGVLTLLDGIISICTGLQFRAHMQARDG